MKRDIIHSAARPSAASAVSNGSEGEQADKAKLAAIERSRERLQGCIGGSRRNTERGVGGARGGYSIVVTDRVSHFEISPLKARARLNMLLRMHVMVRLGAVRCMPRSFSTAGRLMGEKEQCQ